MHKCIHACIFRSFNEYFQPDLINTAWEFFHYFLLTNSTKVVSLIYLNSSIPTSTSSGVSRKKEAGERFSMICFSAICSTEYSEWHCWKGGMIEGRTAGLWRTCLTCPKFFFQQHKRWTTKEASYYQVFDSFLLGPAGPLLATPMSYRMGLLNVVYDELLETNSSYFRVNLFGFLARFLVDKRHHVLYLSTKNNTQQCPPA